MGPTGGESERDRLLTKREMKRRKRDQGGQGRA